MYSSKAALPDKVQRLQELLLSFSREANNQISRQRAVRKSSAKQRCILPVKSRVIPAVHPPEHAVAAALQGKMKVRRKVRIGFQTFAEVRPGNARLQ